MSKPPPPTIGTAAIRRCPNNDGHIVAAAYRNSTSTEWELDLVITSLNWCSAKTRRGTPWGEIGIHIQRPGVAGSAARHIERRIEQASDHGRSRGNKRPAATP